MNTKEQQLLTLPPAMLDEIAREAGRLDRSLSWCVQRAWTTARTRIAELVPSKSHPAVETLYAARYERATQGVRETRRALFFPAEMLREIKRESKRQQRPLSWVMQRAWCVALDDIAALPSSS